MGPCLEQAHGGGSCVAPEIAQPTSIDLQTFYRLANDDFTVSRYFPVGLWQAALANGYLFDLLHSVRTTHNSFFRHPSR